MKRKIISSLLLGVCCSLMGIASSAKAISLTMSSSQYLGNAVEGLPESEADNASIINHLTPLSLGGTTTFAIGPHNNLLTRSSNVLGPFTTATSVNSVKDGGLDFGGGYEYLAAFYGAGNDLPLPTKSQTLLVWDVSGLSGSFDIPTKALSHYVLLNPGTSVPDGGTTMLLLGSALTGLGLVSRRLKK